MKAGGGTTLVAGTTLGLGQLTSPLTQFKGRGRLDSHSCIRINSTSGTRNFSLGKIS